MAISDFFSGGNTPDYLSGLLDDEQLQKLKAQAQKNAMLQFGLSALAQGGYSQTPVGIGEILGKAGMAGMQGYQQGVQSGIEGIGTRAKLEEMQRVKKQRQAEDLFRSRIGQPNATRDVMTQPTAQVPVAQGMEAPNFQTQMQPPTVTQEKYFSPDVMLKEALSSGVLPFDKYLELSAKQKTESPFAKVDPSKFTTESINKFNMTGNYGDLVATKEEKTFKVGDTRDFVSGTNRITQEYQKDGTWKNISTGSAFAPASQVNVNMPSESERTAGFLTSRLQNSLNQLQSVTNKNPKAAKPVIGAEAVRTLTGSDYLTNLANPESRQQIEAAQLEILDSALTLGTGAAYTREQLQNYSKSYFPQLGDKPNTIKDKQARLAALLKSAKIKGGRASPEDVGLPANVSVERVR